MTPYESTSMKDIRMARNISREGNREQKINYNMKDLNQEVHSAVEIQSLKQLPRYQIHHRSFLPAILFIRTGHLGRRSHAGTLKRQKTTGMSIQDFVTMPLIEEQYAALALPVPQIFAGEVQRKEKAKAGVLWRVC